MKKIYLSILALISTGLPLLAQQEATLHSMQSLPQSHYTNPAFVPQQQFYLGLPGISSTYFSLNNSGFNYNSLIERKPENDSLYINLPRMQEGLANRNYLTNSLQTDLLSFGVKINARMYLMVSSTIKADTRLMYPKGLSGLFINGNAAYLDETVSFSPEIGHISYLENSIGASYIVDNKLTLGGRVKFLRGLANIHTQTADFSLTTDAQTYALHLQGNMQIRSAGIHEYMDGSRNLNDISLTNLPGMQNMGFALDLGATYRFNNRLQFGISALNLGGITWKHDTREYYMNKGSVTFKGLDAQEIANGGDGMDEFMTEFQETFKLQERTLSSYRTALPSQLYLSARYELLQNLHASGLLFAQSFGGRFRPGFSAALNKDFGRRMGASLSYTAANRSYNNLGAGLSLRLSPFQLYMVSDNIISTPVFYKSAKALSLRMGMNLVFGYRKSPAKLPYAN